MPPLKRIRQEKLAQLIVNEPKLSQTKAYMKVYGTNNPDSARASASEILAKPTVRERVLELLEKRNAGLGRVSERLQDHLESSTETTSLETCKVILRVAGAFDEQKSDGNMQNIQINLNVIAPNSNT